MMFDYYGLSQRVAAVRLSPWRCADRAGTPNRAAPVRKRALRAGLAGAGLSHPCVNEGDVPCNPDEKAEAPCNPYEKGDAPCNPYEKTEAPCNPYEKGDAPCNPYEKTDAPCNPYEKGDAPCNTYEKGGHGFEESYTYGPVGLTTRTVETQDTDPEDNFDHWVLPDLFGGTSALLLYTGAETDRALAAQHFDAFGVRMATTDAWDTGLDDSRYRWRSQESSETDAFAVAKPLIPNVKLQPPTLVYMQTRHYDPALGRFIMADSIPMGAFSPQGLNRYAYCTNDPVNLSDPEGTGVPAVVALVLALLGLAGSYLIKSLLKRLVKNGLLCQILGLLGSSGIGKLLKLITDYDLGLLGWIGVLLIGTGRCIAGIPFLGWLLGGVIMLVGLILVKIDALLSWVFDSIVDWVFGMRERGKAETRLATLLRRKYDNTHCSGWMQYQNRDFLHVYS